MDDKVKQPSHYTAPSGLTVKQVILDFDLNFALGSAIKYILRAGKKSRDTEVQDLEKAIESINIHLERKRETPIRSDWSGLAAYISAQPLASAPEGKSTLEELGDTLYCLMLAEGFDAEALNIRIILEDIKRCKNG